MCLLVRACVSQGLPRERKTLLDQYEESIRNALADLDRNEVPRRIWERDHTVWKPDLTEIGDRLGWLTVAGDMRESIVDIKTFSDEAKDEGYRHIVLLGMGGSSLGALAIYSLFGGAKGYPELIVLDTTVPDAIASVVHEVDCSKPFSSLHPSPGRLLSRMCFTGISGHLLNRWSA